MNMKAKSSNFVELKTEDGLEKIPLMTKEELENSTIDSKKMQIVMEEGRKEDLELEK